MSRPDRSSNETGNGPALPALPVIPDRYEVKYTVPLFLIEPMVRAVRRYCAYDKYSAAAPDRFYTVNSLYLDTPSYYFLRQRLAKAENRFNMRIRCYGDSPQPPFFLEIKQRRGDVVRKLRGVGCTADLEALADPATVPAAAAGGGKPDLKRELFFRIAHQYNVQPVVLVQYRRQAFVSECDDYARVTFDLDLRSASRHRFDPMPREAEMVPCDTETSFDPGCSVVLELKCPAAQTPVWMLDLVKEFQLKRRGFSKYSNCARHVFGRYRNEGLGTRVSVVERI
jgi:hypothetical protein